MKRLLAAIFAFIALLFGGHHALPAKTPPPPPSLEEQLRSYATPGMLRAAPNADALRVLSLRADLDGSGTYGYVVAEYDVPAYGAKIEVFRTSGGRLQVAGSLDASDGADYSDGSLMSLQYVDNSSSPAVEVDSWGVDGRHFNFDLLKWTGGKLVSILPNTVSFTDAYLADPMGTGVSEVIRPPYCDQGECQGAFEVYRMRNGRYVLTATATADPSGMLPPAGENLPLPGKVTLVQNQFSAAEILSSSSKKGDPNVVLQFGNLAPVSDSSSSTDVAEVDLESIYAGRNLKPSAVRIVGAEQGKAQGFDGPFIEVVLPRAGVLQYLAKAQPSKAPAPGDSVTLPVNARLKNGLALYGFASVRIVGDTGN